MKMIVENNAAEGLEGLLGEQVVILCACYIYSGKLIGVNTSCIKLEDAAIVYETGEWSAKKWKDSQPIGTKYFYVATGMIESFGLGK